MKKMDLMGRVKGQKTVLPDFYRFFFNGKVVFYISGVNHDIQ